MDHLFIVYCINVKYWHQVMGHMHYQQHNSEATRCQYLTLMLYTNNNNTMNLRGPCATMWGCATIMDLRCCLQLVIYTLVLSSPSGICLPGTELLQSPFRMEFSMGSRSRRYWQSDITWDHVHRRFLQSYRWFLRRCRDPWGDQGSPIVARLTKHKTW